MSFDPAPLLRTARGRCPRCEARLPDAPFWDVAPACASCGLVLRRRGGFFLGALVWNYGLVAFGYLPLLLIPGALGWIGWKTVAWAAAAGGLILPWFIHGFAWRVWIGIYYGFLPDQMGREMDD